MPFWDYNTLDQLHLFETRLQPADLVVNAAWLGHEMVPPGTPIGDGRRMLTYITMLRNPIDRVLASLLGVQSARYMTLAELARERCPVGHRSFPCWDADFYVQALGGRGPCRERQGADEHAASSSHGLPPPTSPRLCDGGGEGEDEDEATRRLETFEVVLMRDWLHLSAPLVCVRLGWCDEPAFQSVVRQVTAQDRQAACEVRAMVVRTGMHSKRALYAL